MNRVVNLLSEFKGRHIYYCPNPGNAGDSAIATATYQMFDNLNIEYSLIKWNQDFQSDGKIVIYGGGGNLTKSGVNARYFIKKHHKKADHLVILPHTIQGNKDLLQKLGSNVHLFCREKKSLKWVKKCTSGANVYIDHDIAFNLKISRLLQDEVFDGQKAIFLSLKTLLGGAMNSLVIRSFGSREIFEPSLPLGKASKYCKDVFLRVFSSDKKSLVALRVDNEKNRETTPKSNIDASVVFRYGTHSRYVSEASTAGVLSLFECYDKIITDRLHGGILAAILGKRVELYANNYYKNREVYKYSIRNNYDNVKWCGEWY